MKQCDFIIIILAIISIQSEIFGKTQEYPVKEEIKISLSTCIDEVLKNDFQIIEKNYNIKISELRIDDAKVEFIPYFTSTITAKNSQIPAYSQLEGADLNKQNAYIYSLGLEKKIDTGGKCFLTFNSLEHGSNSEYQFLNPYYQSDLDLTFIQPLLKGFGKKQTNYYIEIDKGYLKISQIELIKQINNSLITLLHSYWDLYFAVQIVQVRKEILKHAEDIFSMNETKKRLGELSEIELSQAKLGVIDKKEKLINSEAEFKIAQNTLKSIISGVDSSKYQNRLLILTDEPSVKSLNEYTQSDFNNALSNNYDYQILCEEIKQKELQESWNKNQKYPEINLVSSAGLNGLSESFSKDINSLSSGNYYQWEIGLQVRVPLDKQNISAKHKISIMELEKTKNQLEQLKKELFLTINEITIKIETDIQKYKLSKESAFIAKNKLQAEKEKYKLGIINTYTMLQYIEDYSQIKSSELKNLVSYTKNYIELKSITGDLVKDYNVYITEIQNKTSNIQKIKELLHQQYSTM